MKLIYSTLKIFICVLTFIFASFVASGQNTQNSFLSNSECLKCHETKISAHKYNLSVHKSLTCEACHVKDESKSVSTSNNKTCVVKFKAMNCASCHSSIAKEHAGSVHNSKRLPVTCSKCHADIHAITSLKNNKLASAKLCSKCHEKESAYFKSIHFEALSKGNNDAPACTDCHGLHSINPIDNVAQGRSFHTKACLKCHGDSKMMEKSKITTIAPKTYFESYHGKNVRLGYPEKVAGCADCHKSHYILPEKDRNSSVNSANLANTCKQCHSGASTKFARYLPHAEPTNRGKNPVLFWITIGMNILLIGTFLFFWIHSLFWAFRGYIERKQYRNKLFFSKVEIQENETVQINKKIYRRFGPVQIVLHLFVVTSFLALAITGLPLKFNYTTWGKSLMDFLGGVHVAGAIHRIGAIITFGYFFVVLVMSSKFLFSQKTSKEPFAKRLFGPDSLFPNRKDLRDIKAMFRWFVFKGPKPSFDRWTYWEKFDFLAVFWGVAVIGSSGLILWFPEFFGKFLPGYFFNIATIIHSDEALLAVGFIFTIHFFNTHIRTEKFPMDFVIFNGQVTEEEMVHERKVQWERYQQLGIAKDFEVNKPGSISRDIFLRLFGFTAVLIGVTLTFLIIYTFFFMEM